jgi:surfactin synthase thioesterase subunit
VEAVRDVAAPGIPLVLFGHSMGALLAHEVAVALPPGMVDLLVVAGTVAPDRPAPNLARASDADMLAALSNWGGTPSAILSDSVMTEVFLPLVRADFAIAEALRRRFDPDKTLDIPLLALAGSDDPVAPTGEMCHWSRWTKGRFTGRVIPGGHFFPVSAAMETLQVLEEVIAGL